MNLTEAHAKQRQMEEEIDNLQKHLLDSLSQDEEKHSAESPAKLYRKIESMLNQLHRLYDSINKAVSQARVNDKPFIEVIGDGRVLDKRIEVIEAILSLSNQHKESFNNTLDMDLLSKQLYTLQERKRDLNAGLINAMENTQLP
jgi:hypothetical protein